MAGQVRKIHPPLKEEFTFCPEADFLRNGATCPVKRLGRGRDGLRIHAWPDVLEFLEHRRTQPLLAGPPPP